MKADQNELLEQATTVEFQLMCKLLQIKDDDEIDIKYLEQLNWDQFMELILHHRVYPLIYPKLQRMSSHIPPEIMKQLAHGVMTNTFFMMKLTAELERLLSSMEGAGIDVLTLKGPVLSQELYGDLAHRTSKDLDLLVKHKDVDVVLSLLEGLGYVKQYEEPYILGSWKWKDHHIPLIHPKLKTQVEIHWSLNPSGARNVPFADLWKRRRTTKIVNREVSHLGKEDLFMYLISHGARHGWFRLRWLTDIDHIIRNHQLTEDLTFSMEEHEAKYYAGQAFYLCAHLLNTPLRNDMRLLSEDRVSIRWAEYAFELINDAKIPQTQKLKQYLIYIKSPKRKLFMLLGRLYPGPQDAVLLPLPRMLHFLYVPLRPFLWIWRRAKQ
ncbi:nucleotidyltransferase family protein [Paenibacillus sp. Marseille-Q4541]|uniref:nucleotidyltransferase domain-containing protein n=1 Tax=Paenibacillus sp. Marseille-Q4541 TaxID=2831522 RepID=UPI001BA82E98|nr:nucleotidyltransferase family protein [Paenibacillus sp. Marseille-Q4541]